MTRLPLTNQQNQELSQVVNAIVACIDTEKVFLLGLSSKTYKSHNIFLSEPVKWDLTYEYNLLVLTGDNEKRNNDELQEIIEKRSGNSEKITAYLLPIAQFNDWLKTAHPFAFHVTRTALLCYDSGRVNFLKLPDCDPSHNYRTLQNDFDRYNHCASEFLAGAELYIIRKEYRLAAFHLHQVAEQICIGIIRLVTGLRVCTHNLDKLYRYSKPFSEKLSELFPRDSAAEVRLFDLLKKAYSKARYDPDYTIASKELAELFQRVRKLFTIAKDTRKENLIAKTKD